MKLIDYLNYYLGCNMLFDNKEWEIFRIESTNKGVLVTGKRYFATGGWRHNSVWATECMLILRRLSDLTLTELEALAMIYSGAKRVEKTTGIANNWHYFNCYFGENEQCERLIIASDGSAWYAHYFDKDQPGHRNIVNEHEAFHLLLQHHFDIFNLIDAGLAVDAKTIQP